MPTTIKLKNSVTTTNAPSSLVQGEVAINITDKKVWVGNAATTPIQLLGAGSSASFGALTCTSLTNSGLTSGRVTYATTAGLLTDSANLTFNGTTLTAAALTSTGVATFSAGTVSAPAITTTGDTNTGIFFPAADTIAFTEGGVESMRIDSSGNVVIGTTASLSSYKTTIQHTSGELLALNASSGTLTRIAFGNADTSFGATQIIANSTSLALITGAAERMRITSAGDVGIGTSSPSQVLEVSKSQDTETQIRVVNSSTGSSARSAVVFGNNSNAGAAGILLNSSNNTGLGGANALNMYQGLSAPIAFFTNATERMRITSGGTLIVNDTATSSFFDGRVSSFSATLPGLSGKTSGGAAMPAITSWNTATSGDNLFLQFATETTATARGSIDYNRGAGLVRYNTTSDATLKNIIGDSDGKKSIDILKSTRIREYAWKDDAEQKPQIGVIAQELYETYKGAVSVGGDIEKTDDEGNVTTEYKPWAVDKTAFTFHLIAGWQAHQKLIQEQQAMIEELKQEVAKLKGV